MKISELLVPELEHEVKLTETFLNRIPEDKMDWAPHEKSMTLGALGNHLADIPMWITVTMKRDEFEVDDYKPHEAKDKLGMVKTLKANAAIAIEALKVDDEDYWKTWKMIKGDVAIMEMPKYKVLRSAVINQLPHHRAQLGVYLRLLDIPVPATYGPSADE